MSSPKAAEARGLWGAVLRWAAALAELFRGASPAPESGTCERLACGRLALHAARGMQSGATAPESAELLVLALANARAAALSLDAARRRIASAPDDAPEGGDLHEQNLERIVQRSIEDDLSAEPAQLRDDLELLLAYGERLQSELEAPARRARAVRRRAWATRLAPPLALAIIVALVGWALLRPRDLAAGKPWATSSVGDTCDPVHARCAGAHSTILFHTREESEPWFEIDLGKAQELTGIQVRNRSDCCADRAVPLVVELSLDHSQYRTVARKFTTFDDWSPRFPATRARYVRLRVTRRGILHLERVQVFGRNLE